MIPMRDGAKLHTIILRPAGSETSGRGAAVPDDAHALWRRRMRKRASR